MAGARSHGDARPAIVGAYRSIADPARPIKPGQRASPAEASTALTPERAVVSWPQCGSDRGSYLVLLVLFAVA
jgi:hypothetical protein